MELIAMALIVAAIIVGQYVLYDKYGLKKVLYKLYIGTPEAFEGDDIEIVEEIENAKWLPLVWVRSEISCSPWLTFKGQTLVKNELDEQRGLISGIFVLRGYRKCRRVWKVKCEKRGIMTIDNVIITASDLFGLSKNAMVLEITDTVRVLPTPADMETGELSGDLFIGNMQVRRFVLPDPFMISGAREYTGREPMNRIHWQQTARTGNLMAYKNEFTTERRILIILNLQRNAVNITQPMNPSVLEAQIKAAAFALDYCVKASAECALAVNAAERLYLSPNSGFAHIMSALRLLAELENVCGEHLDDMLPALDYNEFTDVILITSCVTARTSEILSGLTNGGKCCKIFTTGLNGEENMLPPACEAVHIPRR
ncbi:MAG: DUF58 domain-containing protein [Lachnospiraceae bacterium]|nr:DUF58 domain-containing protein [Ruminococcus sp.]MCM1276443.1 DUF58 domain-containing protein [Lachnospiraceae bacterium]